jgi:hypothetical protein
MNIINSKYFVAQSTELFRQTKSISAILLIFISIGARCAVDPAPEHATFELDSKIRLTGAYISLIDSVPDHNITAQDRIQIISADADSYYFMFPGKSLKIKIVFRDSTQKYASITNNKSRYPKYVVKLNQQNTLLISDITNYVDRITLLNFIAIAFVIFIIIKLLPTWIIIFPKDKLTFVKHYGLAQVVYSLLFSFLIFFFHGSGALISVILLFIALSVDNYILKNDYLDTKGSRRISISIFLSTLFTLAFCIVMLFAFVLLA